jgi:hypothetical protein
MWQWRRRFLLCVPRNIFGKGVAVAIAETLRILDRAGKGNPPMEGDELPQEWQKKPGRKVENGRDSARKRGQKKRAAVK